MAVDRMALLRFLAHVVQAPISEYDIAKEQARLAAETPAVLGVDAAAVLLRERQGSERPVAASDDAAWDAAVVQTAAEQGPSWDCARTGDASLSDDLYTEARWPTFARAATTIGFRSACAFPMAASDQFLGSLVALRRQPGHYDADTVGTGKLLAQAAATQLLNAKAYSHLVELSEQLQQALSSRVVIEQAKGRLATQLGITPDAAFERIRRQARSEQRKLHDLAESIMRGVEYADDEGRC